MELFTKGIIHTPNIHLSSSENTMAALHTTFKVEEARNKKEAY